MKDIQVVIEIVKPISDAGIIFRPTDGDGDRLFSMLENAFPAPAMDVTEFTLCHAGGYENAVLFQQAKANDYRSRS
jgi:hypothetical protein